MIKSVFLVIFIVLSAYSDSSFLDSLQKCSINDSECIEQMSECLKNNLADNGLPELGIPRLDPMPLINQTVSVIGFVDVTMVDGVAEGMKNCKVHSFDTNIETKLTKFDMFCDVFTVKGAYNIQSAPLVDKLFGNVVTGEGIGSVVMEKLKMNFTHPFDIAMHDDGEIYLAPDYEKAEYSYEILDKVTFKANNITIGILQIAPTVTSFLNRNWEYVMGAFGTLFSDKGMSLSYSYAKKFFEAVPASKFISDDLRQYLKIARPASNNAL